MGLREREVEMAEVIKAPSWFATNRGIPVFLAGSIEMGKAEDWQEKVTAQLRGLDVMILNPRRDDWDSSWEQSIHNPQFREQVEWELSALEHAAKEGVVFLYLAPGTKSPISLLELGLHCQYETGLVVCCPEGFWRKGNVDIVCDRHSIPVYETMEEAVVGLKEVLGILAAE
jgi:hypothetical protein